MSEARAREWAAAFRAIAATWPQGSEIAIAYAAAADAYEALADQIAKMSA